MNEEKEVYFDQYCKSCKYHGLEESKDPCNDCLAEPSNVLGANKSGKRHPRGVTCLFCGLDYPCPHMPGLEEQVAMAHKLRKEIEKNG